MRIAVVTWLYSTYIHINRSNEYNLNTLINSDKGYFRFKQMKNIIFFCPRPILNGHTGQKLFAV